MTTVRDLTALFDPKSVAVLGASNDETKYGNWLSVQAVRMADRRAVHLVNRRGESILGRPALRSLAELEINPCSSRPTVRSVSMARIVLES